MVRSLEILYKMDISLRQTVGCTTTATIFCTATATIFCPQGGHCGDVHLKFCFAFVACKVYKITDGISKSNNSFDPSSLLYFVDPQRRRKLLFGKLQVLAEQDNGLGSIIMSLLLTPDDCQSGQQANDVMQFLLEWLLGMNI